MQIIKELLIIIMNIDDIEYIKENIIRGDTFKGVKTGIRTIDDITGGLSDADLILISSRPCMGKTDLVLNLVKEISLNQKKKCVVFDLVSGKKAFIRRLILLLSEIGKTEFVDENNQAQMDALETACQLVSESPLYVDEAIDYDITNIESKCRKHYEDNDIGLIVIDINDLRHFRCKDNNGNYIYKNVSNSLVILKLLAKELNCPIVITTELPRSVEVREDKRPYIEDLCYSETYDEYFDKIIFLYRDDYYFRECKNNNEMEIIVAKNNYGKVGTSIVSYDKEIGIITNL